jgi:fucose 4-O-acetylase-like acetyltransferase
LTSINTNEPAKKYNYKLGYLRAIAIILVVVGHSTSGGMNLLSDWFSPLSFQVPLLIFVGGYFYDETIKAFTYVKKRFRRLVITYYSWNAFYAVLFLILTSTGLLVWGYSVNLETFFVKPWADSNQYAFTLAGWFVLSLFLIQISYLLIRRALAKVRIPYNEYHLFIFFLALGLLSTYLAVRGYSPWYSLIVGRTIFGLPFLQLGYLYKVKLEKFDETSFWSILAVFVIQFALILTYGQVTFSMVYMDFGGRIIEPFLFAFTGIWLCLQISSILATHINPLKVLRYIGDNSWSIMINQFLGFWILNSIFFIVRANGFNEIAYKTDMYYKYVIGGHEQSLILYVLAGIFFALLLGYGASKVREQLCLHAGIFFQRTKDETLLKHRPDAVQ